MKQRIVVERSNARAVSRALWDGLIKFNVGQAGPVNYERHGYYRFGRLSGSLAGASRHYYVKRLRPSGKR